MKQLERFLKRKSVRKVLGDDYILTKQQAERLLLILDTARRVKEFEDWLSTFAHFIRNDLTNYVGRFRRLRRLPACPSLYSLLLRYGKQEALLRHQSYNRQRGSNLANTVSYWLERGMGISEALARVKAVQVERSGKSAQVLRGTSEYSIRSVTYWMKQGWTLEAAKEKVRQVQTTNGVEAYQQRGHADPIASQLDRNRRWIATLGAKDENEVRRIKLAKSHTIEGCLARGLEPEEAEATSVAYFSKRRNYSSISQVCFNMVRDRIGGDGLYYKLYNYEKQFSGKNVDFFDSKSGIVIEFLGDFWHANPLFYRERYRIYSKFACDIRLDDRRRFAKIEGHPLIRQLYIVWESEFRRNPHEVASLIAEALLEMR